MKKIYIVDGNSFVYRMFYAIPPMTSPDGTPVNSVFGMAKFLMGLRDRDKPDYLYMVRDAKGKSFRSEMYEDYKATREKAPDDLKVQFDIVNKMIRST
jgi:DNA polymerase-1